MVLRVPIWTGVAIALSTCAPAPRERCEQILAVAQAQTRMLAGGCETAADCMPLSGACGTASAVRADADTRELTRTILRYEELCACSGGAPIAPAICESGQCVARRTLATPAACNGLRDEMVRDVDQQNRCRNDADCTTFHLLTCPPVCSRPTARTADPGKVASLLLEYNRTPGCSPCEPTCSPPPRTRCIGGLCATEAQVPGDCPTLELEIARHTLGGLCSSYADCAYVDYQGVPFAASCGSATTRDLAPRLAQLALAWRERCCAHCPATCSSAPVESARCDGRRCIRAVDCPRRLAAAARGWSIAYRIRPADPDGRSLLVREDGLAVLSPPGLEAQLTAGEQAQIAALADGAAILCLDGSFHRVGDTPYQLVTSAPELGQTDLRFSTADALPSGLPELQRALEAVMARLTRP